MPNNILTPVTRNGKFYSEEDFQYETGILDDYLEGDLHQTVVVYQVDREKTNTGSVYKESTDIRFKMPVEIPCIYEIDESVLKSIDKNTTNGVYAQSGQLKLYVMPMTLKKYECDISRGDYIGILVDNNRMVYYVVVNDGKINYTNKNIVGAYRPAWLNITCSPVTDKEFNG